MTLFLTNREAYLIPFPFEHTETCLGPRRLPVIKTERLPVIKTEMESKQILESQFIILCTENIQNPYNQIIAIVTAVLKSEGVVEYSIGTRIFG